MAGFLGELGGLIGRGIGTWTGFGFLEKKEEDLLKIEEGTGEGSDVGIALERGSLSGMPRKTLKLSFTALFSLGIGGYRREEGGCSSF